MPSERKLGDKIDLLFREFNITEHIEELEYLLNEYIDRDLEYLSKALENLYKTLSNLENTEQDSLKNLKKFAEIKENLNRLRDTIFPKGNFPFNKMELLKEFKELVENSSNFKVKIRDLK